MVSSQIFTKLLRLRFGNKHAASALTLISTDVEGIVSNVGQIHGVWIAVGECAFAVYFLYREIGAPCFLPIISIISKYTMFRTVVSPLRGDIY